MPSGMDSTRPPSGPLTMAAVASSSLLQVGCFEMVGHPHQRITSSMCLPLNPVTPAHLFVVPREHAVGLEDLDAATSARAWSVGHDMARALRRFRMGCEGINLLVGDGEAAFQTVFHFHLHVILHYTGDGWTLKPERARSLLDSDAEAVKSALASRTEG